MFSDALKCTSTDPWSTTWIEMKLPEDISNRNLWHSTVHWEIAWYLLESIILTQHLIQSSTRMHNKNAVKRILQMKWQVWGRQRGVEMGRWREKGLKTIINTYFNRQQQSSFLLQSFKSQSFPNKTKTTSKCTFTSSFKFNCFTPPKTFREKKAGKMSKYYFPCFRTKIPEKWTAGK